MYKIMVDIPESKILRFTVKEYSKKNNKVYFIDEITGLNKEFPDAWCAIEEMSEKWVQKQK